MAKEAEQLLLRSKLSFRESKPHSRGALPGKSMPNTECVCIAQERVADGAEPCVWMSRLKPQG